MNRSLDLLFSFLLLLVGTISIITTATISSTSTNIKMILVMLTALSFILTGLLLGKYMFTPDELDDTISTTNTATNANTVNNDDNSLIAPVPNTATDANNASTNDTAVNNDVNTVSIARISTTESVISNDSGSSDDDTAGTVSSDKTTATKPNSILSSIIHS